jgi:hypothetical protein
MGCRGSQVQILSPRPSRLVDVERAVDARAPARRSRNPRRVPAPQSDARAMGLNVPEPSQRNALPALFVGALFPPQFADPRDRREPQTCRRRVGLLWPHHRARDLRPSRQTGRAVWLRPTPRMCLSSPLLFHPPITTPTTPAVILSHVLRIIERSRTVLPPPSAVDPAGNPTGPWSLMDPCSRVERPRLSSACPPCSSRLYRSSG